jgi:hypothetical protein
MGLFGLEIGWNVARAFLMEAALTALLPDFLYSGGSATSVVLFIISLFLHLFQLWLLDILLLHMLSPPIIFFFNKKNTLLFSTNNFISCQLFAALVSGATKMHTFIRARGF